MTDKDKSKINFSKCEDARGLKKDELPSYGAAMISSLNLASCYNQATSDEEIKAFGGNVNVILMVGSIPVPILVGGASVIQAENYKTSTTISCEQLSQIAQRNYNTSEKIKCILSQTSTAISTVADAINDIKFMSDGDVRIICPNGLDFSQSINIKVNNTNEYTDTQINQITDELINNTKNVIKSLQDSSNEWGATPQGQRSYQEALNKVESSDFKSQTRQTVVDITSEVQADNSILLKSKGDLLISGDQCKITQNTVLDIVSQTMINSVMSNAFSEVRKNINEFISQTTTKAENKGITTIAGLIQNAKTAVIIGVLVIFVAFILGLVYYFTQ